MIYVQSYSGTYGLDNSLRRQRCKTSKDPIGVSEAVEAAAAVVVVVVVVAEEAAAAAAVAEGEEVEG